MACAERRVRGRAFLCSRLVWARLTIAWDRQVYCEEAEQEGAERSGARRRAQFAEYMRRCVPVSEIITIVLGFRFQSRPVVSERFHFISEAHSQPSSPVSARHGALRGWFACEQEGVNGSCRLGPHCYSLFFISIRGFTPRTPQAPQPAHAGLEVRHGELVTVGGGWCDYFLLTLHRFPPSPPAGCR